MRIARLLSLVLLPDVAVPAFALKRDAGERVEKPDYAIANWITVPIEDNEDPDLESG